ncbi:MAG: hypothetical protein EB168_08835, partial [Euryarchaeota archaeon]|nr:hypothetical protein [Euryarchaeota archaeon]
NRLINGWANCYWGWGGEDRNYMHRLRNYEVRPEEWGLRGNPSFRELEDLHDPARKEFKKAQQKITKRFQKTPSLNQKDGLSQLRYVTDNVSSYPHIETYHITVDLLHEE